MIPTVHARDVEYNPIVTRSDPDSNRYELLIAGLREFIPDHRLFDDPLRTVVYGTDASFYRMTPQVVVDVASEAEIVKCLGLATRHRTPVTFRAAGTSLSGQAVTDAVLLRLGSGWQNLNVSDDGALIRLQPGVIGGHANASLAPLGRKIGPDPASIDAAMIGGIAANNASGMCCGTAQNSYQTLASMRVVLSDGAVLDTGDAESRDQFAQTHGTLLAGLAALGQRTRRNAALSERIRRKFRIKNTTGYSLNALVDYTDPFEILQHLFIGSEGTLGFISEITYRTVEEHREKASALVVFADIGTACEAVIQLKACPVAAVELMDRAALRSVHGKPGMPDYLRELPAEATALLVETRAPDAIRLDAQVAEVQAVLAAVETLFPVGFTAQPEEYQKLWNVRKGLFPAVGAVRAAGTTVVIEDVVFEVPKLADGTRDLQALLAEHGYGEAIIFGHALEGNLHFVFTQGFGDPAEVERYRRLMDDVCHLVVDKYDGSLKGEHSTGRNMAPYVELEWGAEAHALMREIKTVFDPDSILNPGVILNDDPEAHVKHLKPLFPADPLVDKCTECGFCEPHCPSRALTLTPRQRIAGLRELARLEASGQEAERLEEMRSLYAYQAIATCAGDGLCSKACPVGIDTGRMIKGLRGQQTGAVGHRIAGLLARNYGAISKAVRMGLGIANLCHAALGTRAMSASSAFLRRVSGNHVPLWTRYLPRPALALPRAIPPDGSASIVVYFPSCASRIMGPARGDPEDATLPQATHALLRKAGFDVVYPKACDGLCCGTPFESKGMAAQADAKLRELEQALYDASEAGRHPVLFDTSVCALRLKQNLHLGIEVQDILEFIRDRLVDRLDFRRLPETVAVHSTCSTRKMGLEDELQSIARRCAQTVIVPEGVGCCGWAGDKGFTVPELNASALRNLRPALTPDCRNGYSTSRSCEIGLSQHSDRYYRSIVYLVNRSTTPKSSTAGARPASAT